MDTLGDDEIDRDGCIHIRSEKRTKKEEAVEEGFRLEIAVK